MGAGASLLRFTATERAFHWAFALAYLSLLVTGLPLWLSGLRPWIPWWNRTIGVRLHLSGAVLWLAVPLLVFGLGDRGALRGAGKHLARFAPGDWAWLRRFPRWFFGRAREPGDVDRFNAGQKFYASFTAATSALLLLTGLALWPAGEGSAVLGDFVLGPGSVRAWRDAHKVLMLLILCPLGAHLFFALLHPRTRPSLSGMLRGRVPAGWAAAEHPRWFRRVAPPSEPRPPR